MNDEAEKLRAELERVQKQFGTCSVCGYIAWRERDRTTDDCRYCALEKQVAAMREMLLVLKRDYTYREGIPAEMEAVESALAVDVGKDYIRRSDVQFMFDALMAISTDQHNPVWWKTTQEALQRAFALGFRECKPVPPV